MVDFRTKVHEFIEVNIREIQQFIEMNCDSSASENASTEECG